jgi:glyoxylase-like metal-dependent hydrolase (beta-lactamase superfamily II)
MRSRSLGNDTYVLTSAAPVPGIGFLPINAFVIGGANPVLVDTGIFPDSDEFIAAVSSIVDPADLRWIWLTHSDRDHTGSISRMLELAPNARVVAHFITVGLMGNGCEPIPPQRAYLVRDGSRVDLGDRVVTAFRPPLFDNPGTVGFYDPARDTAFCSDCFGAPMPTEEDAFTDDVASVSESELVSGQLLWGSVDAPWVHAIDESKLAQGLDAFASLGAGTVLSTHLPPIRSALDAHLKTLSRLPSSDPFAAPDQDAMEALMAQIAH